MAKRFTDTDKFTDVWYRRLSSKHKLLWEYLLCACDHAGIISIDLEFIEMVLKEKFDDDVIAKVFSDRVLKLEKPFVYFIPKFVSFQYGELSGKSPMHLKVIRSLRAAGINPDTLEAPLDRVSTGYQVGTKQSINTLEEEEEREEEVKEEEEREEEVKANGKLEKATTKRAKKVKPMADHSPLEILFRAEGFEYEDLRAWLRTGTVPLQQKLLDTYDGEYLAKTIEKAYYWQLENKKRSAGTFLSSWIDRDKERVLKKSAGNDFGEFMKDIASQAAAKFGEA